MKKTLMFFIFIAVLVSVAYAVPAANPVVRVGLYYNDSALPSANLQNIDGYGYRFGFFDTTHTFISLHSNNTANRISMLKDRNFYYSDGAFYESSQPSGSKLIGAYHIQLETNYATSAEAAGQASVLNLQGITAFPAYVNGTYKLRIGTYPDTVSAQSATMQFMYLGASTVVGNSAKCVTVVNTANGSVLFEYDNGGAFGVYPSCGEVTMPLTWFKGYKYYGGFQYTRDSGNISVVNFVPMQQYVMGVIPYEMSPAWPTEALKAQALCARTYALYNYGKHGANFDVCGTTDCQVYRGANSATENSDAAVIATYGQYILYDGKPINAVFHSSDGGATENSENVWSATLPYLRGVYDSYEDLDSCINGRWSYEYTPSEITSILTKKGYSIGLITDMYVKEYTPTGNVLTLTVTDINGKTLNFSRERARTILYSSTYKKYTHSQRYKVTKKGASASASTTLYINNAGVSADLNYDTIFAIGANKTTSVLSQKNIAVMTASGITTVGSNNNAPTSSGPVSFVVSGTGWGHNVGMSQNGAKAMANLGSSATDIINFYYTDVEIFTAS